MIRERYHRNSLRVHAVRVILAVAGCRQREFDLDRSAPLSGSEWRLPRVTISAPAPFPVAGERLQWGLYIGEALAMTKMGYLDIVELAASGGVSRITKNLLLRP